MTSRFLREKQRGSPFGLNRYEAILQFSKEKDTGSQLKLDHKSVFVQKRYCPELRLRLRLIFRCNTNMLFLKGVCARRALNPSSSG